MVLVHRRAAAGGEQHRFCLDDDELAGAHIDEQHAGEGVAVLRTDQFDRAVLLEPEDAARPHLFGQATDDFDAGQIALVDGAIEGLSGERFLMDRPVGIAVEETAELVFEFADAGLRAGHQRPGEVLVIQPLAALDRVHEVSLDRIAGCERNVVSALNHARAAGFSEQALDRNRDLERGIGLVRVQRREQTGAARAENEDVGL